MVVNRCKRSRKPCDRNRCGIIAVLLALFVLPALPGTALPADRSAAGEQPQCTDRPDSGRFHFFPTVELYPAYAADPVRVGFGVQPLTVSRGEIPDSGRRRISLRAGGTLGIVRADDGPGQGWQVSLLGGFNDQNDVVHSLDNIGWDGHYGLLFALAPQNGLAFKLALQHVSSHVGDEYIERTGRKRIGYTRQELAAGVSWFPRRRWRFYGEAGKSFFLSNRELQEPWRAQAGVEYETLPFLFGGLMGWYGAVDSQSWQERDWRVDIAVQSGLVAHSAGRTWRVGLEWYQGRPPIGEFFQYTERYLSLGLWIDL